MINFLVIIDLIIIIRGLNDNKTAQIDMKFELLSENWNKNTCVILSNLSLNEQLIMLI